MYRALPGGLPDRRPPGRAGRRARELEGVRDSDGLGPDGGPACLRDGGLWRASVAGAGDINRPGPRASSVPPAWDLNLKFYYLTIFFSNLIYYSSLLERSEVSYNL